MASSFSTQNVGLIFGSDRSPKREHLGSVELEREHVRERESFRKVHNITQVKIWKQR